MQLVIYPVSKTKKDRINQERFKMTLFIRREIITNLKKNNSF